jgi:hypothetical protein
MTTPIFTEGQQVVVLDRGHRTETTIDKVGRKYAHVTVYGRPYTFDATSGVQAGNTYGSPMRITTPELQAAQDERSAAVTRLRELGIVPEGFGGFKVSTATLHKLIDVLREDEG